MGGFAADIQTAFAPPSVGHIKTVRTGAGHGVGHNRRLARSVADIAQRMTAQVFGEPFPPDIRSAVFALQERRGQTVEQIIPQRPGTSAQPRQRFRAAQHFDLRRNGNTMAVAAHFMGELLGQIMGKGLPVRCLAARVGMIPKGLVISGLGQARAVSHQRIHILIAVADQIGCSIGFAPRPRFACRRYRRQQSRRMKPADHTDHGACTIGQRIPQAGGHVRLAGIIIRDIELITGGRGAQGGAIGAHVLQKPAPVGVAQSGFEQMIPKFEPVTASQPVAERTDVVAAVERLFLHQRLWAFVIVVTALHLGV